MAGVEHTIDIERFQSHGDVQPNPASKDGDQPTANTKPKLDWGAWTRSPKEDNKGGKDGQNSNPGRQTPRVPSHWKELIDKESKESCFVPKVFSIGPYHHGTEHLKDGETYKRQLARQFIEKLGVDNEMVDMACSDIYDKIETTQRECYAEEVTTKFDKEKLTEILFVDGCSVLRYIDRYVKNRLNDLGINKQHLDSIQMDLLLLENQLPYWVLERLMQIPEGDPKKKMAEGGTWPKHSLSQSKWENTIEEFIDKNIGTPKAITSLRFLWYLLLALLIGPICLLLCGICCLTCLCAPFSNDTEKDPGEAKASAGKKGKKDSCTYDHLLGHLHTRLVGESSIKLPDNREEFPANILETCPRRKVTELTAQGMIRLKPSWSNKLNAVSFTPCRFTGQLKLPRMSIDRTWKTRFVNLIAYEMTPKFEGCCGVISFVRFLDLLIDDAKDVEQLKAAWILYNFLGSNEDVAKLSNDMGKHLNELKITDRTDLEAYRVAKLRIENYCNDSTRRTVGIWWAEIREKYFKSPWAFIALIAGSLSLMLSGISAYNSLSSLTK